MKEELITVEPVVMAVVKEREPVLSDRHFVFTPSALAANHVQFFGGAGAGVLVRIPMLGEYSHHSRIGRR